MIWVLLTVWSSRFIFVTCVCWTNIHKQTRENGNSFEFRTWTASFYQTKNCCKQVKASSDPMKLLSGSYRQEWLGWSLALASWPNNCQDNNRGYDEEDEDCYAGPLPWVLLQLPCLLEGCVPALNMVHCARDLRWKRAEQQPELSNKKGDPVPTWTKMKTVLVLWNERDIFLIGAILQEAGTTWVSMSSSNSPWASTKTAISKNTCDFQKRMSSKIKIFPLLCRCQELIERGDSTWW